MKIQGDTSDISHFGTDDTGATIASTSYRTVATGTSSTPRHDARESTTIQYASMLDLVLPVVLVETNSKTWISKTWFSQFSHNLYKNLNPKNSSIRATGGATNMFWRRGTHGAT